MSFEFSESKIKTIRPNDPRFLLRDGHVLSPRAGFEISTDCPREYKLILAQCIDNGWLKPIASVYGKELTMDALR